MKLGMPTNRISQLVWFNKIQPVYYAAMLFGAVQIAYACFTGFVFFGALLTILCVAMVVSWERRQALLLAVPDTAEGLK